MELLQIACAPFLTGALQVAARAGIADLLQHGPLSVEELAAETGLHPEVLLRILRVLAAAQIFHKLEDGRFENSEASEPLRSDHKASMRYFCMLAGSEYSRAFGDIMHTARTGESAFRHLYGESIYAYMDQNREVGRVYDLAMEDLARPVGRLLADRYDFSGLSVVVDIGGGGGILLKEILRANPALHGICLDRADVCQRARERLAQSGEDSLMDRLVFTDGDFFGAIPADADLYLLKNVLHNWTDESSLRILKAIRAVMKPDTRLLVLEPLIEAESENFVRLMDDLFQMVVCEGGTTARTEQQMRDLLLRADLAVLDVFSLPTGHKVVVSAPLLRPAP